MAARAVAPKLEGESNRIKEDVNAFIELMPLLKERTLLITVAQPEKKLKVNVIPTRAPAVRSIADLPN